MEDRTTPRNESTEEVVERLNEVPQSHQVVSERQGVEIQLRNNRKRFRNVGETYSEAVFEADLAGRITYANQRALTITGYSPDDIKAGTNILELFCAHDRVALETDFSKVLRGEHLGPHEYSLVRKDGILVPTLLHSQPITEGNTVVGFRGVLVDISDRKKTEEELTLSVDELVARHTAQLLETNKKLEAQIAEKERIERKLAESENLYRTVVETAKDVIWTTDLSLRYTFVSPSVKEVLGFEVEEMLQLQLMDHLTPDSRGRVVEIFRQEIAREQESTRERFVSRTAEIERFRKDGSKMWIEVTATWLRDAQGHLAGVLGISRDISDRKRAEEALQQAHDELEQRVSDRTAELRATNEKLLDALAQQQRAENALRESEERFRTLFESAQDCIFVKDENLVYTHANPAMVKWMRVPQNKVVGKTDRDLFPGDYAKQAKKVESRVLQGQTIETEQTVVAGHQPRIFNFVRFPMRSGSGNVVGIYGIARDLTDRKREEGDPFVIPEHYPSKSMKEALLQIQLAAKSESVILFLGESGTGKDYMARYLHENSKRATGPFLGINCAALPEDLVESELFGHEPGAFTGSASRKRGLVELAEGGTLLLNEIGELPPRLQAKLLSFLDSQSFFRVGGEKQVSVNSRIVAATNRDLRREVENGNFRPDLYFRLNVFSIQVPPLRERGEDLHILVQELLRSLCQKMGHSKVATVDPAVMGVLAGYEWPGNVRELRNVLERALILCEGNQIRVEHLGVAYHIGFHGVRSLEHHTPALHPTTRSFQDALSETKRGLIEEALQKTGGSIKQAATLLGITRDSLVHYMKSLGIKKK